MFRDAIRHRIRLVTTNLILAEVQRFILFHVGIPPALRVLDRIEVSPLLTVEFATAAHHTSARKWLAQFPDQRISYTDAISFAVMHATRCTTAMGFDHDFELAGFALWRPRYARGRSALAVVGGVGAGERDPVADALVVVRLTGVGIDRRNGEIRGQKRIEVRRHLAPRVGIRGDGFGDGGHPQRARSLVHRERRGRGGLDVGVGLDHDADLDGDDGEREN